MPHRRLSVLARENAPTPWIAALPYSSRRSRSTVCPTGMALYANPRSSVLSHHRHETSWCCRSTRAAGVEPQTSSKSSNVSTRSRQRSLIADIAHRSCSLIAEGALKHGPGLANTTHQRAPGRSRFGRQEADPRRSTPTSIFFKRCTAPAAAPRRVLADFDESACARRSTCATDKPKAR